MTGVNKAILVGHVGKDPEIRRTQDGRPVASFSLATSERWKDKASGERREATEWHRVVVFNEGLSKIVEQYVKKGSKLYVEGQIKTRKWQDKDGHDRYSTEIVLSAYKGQIALLDSGGERQAPSEESYGTQSGAQEKKPDFDDEIPF